MCNDWFRISRHPVQVVDFSASLMSCVPRLTGNFCALWRYEPTLVGLTPVLLQGQHTK